MSKKSTTLVRVNPETKTKIDELRRHLTAIENKDVSTSEIIRRTFNVPLLDDVLKVDSVNKKIRSIK